MATTLDTQGNAVPTTINSYSLGTPQPPVPITTPTYDTTGYNSSANSSLAYTSSALANTQREAEQYAQTQRDLAANSNTDIGRLSSTLNGGGSNLATSTVNQAYNEGGVNDKLAVLNRLNADSLGLNYNNTTIPLALQNEAANTGRTDRGNAPLETKALRDNAIRLASNAYQSAIARNDYETAKSKADEMIAYKYDTTIAEINAKKTNLENIRANLTTAEKKVADATLARLNKEKTDTEKKEAEEKAVADMIIQASPVAPPDVLKRAKEIQAKGGSSTEVAMALGKYGGDFLANEKLKLEMQKVKQSMTTESLQQQKLRGEINAQNPNNPTTGDGSNAKAWLAQYNSGALSLEDIYTKIGSSKEAGVLKNQVAQLVAAQGGKRVYGQDDASIQAINAQVKNIDDLLYGSNKTATDGTTGDVGTIVGFVQGGLGVVPDSKNVYKQNALAIAKNLVSNQTLQALADAKSKGITFGALSEGELGLVADAASRISAKLQIDPVTKEVVGFTGSEGQFIEDLKTIRENLQKSISTKTQDTFVSTGNPTADQFVKQSMGAFNNANSTTPATQAGYTDNQVKP